MTRISTRKWKTITTSFTVERLEMLIDEQNVSLIEEELGEQLCGYYDDRSRSIHVDSRLSYRQKRCTLAHELWHAVFHHERVDARYRVKQERQVRRLTARMLISVEAYRVAESMFPGDNHSIAQELEVTELVLSDFQELIHDELINYHETDEILIASA